MYKQWLKFKSYYIFRTALLKAIRKDLENALEQNDELREVNAALTKRLIHVRNQRDSYRNEIDTCEPQQEWWEAQDRELAMQEAEERADEIQINYVKTDKETI